MLHKNITTGDIHYLQNWSVADTTARDALSVAAADVGKVCQVTGTSTYYILTDEDPMTWQALGSGGGTVTSVTSANADATVATTTTTPVITIVQAPALRSATTTVNVSSATAPSSGQVLTATSGTAATWQTPAAGTGVTLATPQATTSGTTIDFTSIPSGTKVINVMLTGVSTNGTSPLTLRIGDSGGVETTSYLTTETTFNSGSSGTNNYTNGFTFAAGHDTNVTYYGQLVLTLLNSSTNMWVMSGHLARSDTLQSVILTGSKTLSAELDRIQLTSVGGTDAFDAGIMNISYS